MAATTATEGIAGAGVALPQGIVGLAVDATDRLPLLEDGFEAVTGGLPLGGVGSDGLSFGDELFLASDGLLGALLLGLFCLRVGGFGRVDEEIEVGADGVEVADDLFVAEAVGDTACLVGDGRGFLRVCFQAAAEDEDFGAEVVEALREVGESLRRIACLPGADLYLAEGGGAEDSAIVVSTSEGGRVGRCGGNGRCTDEGEGDGRLRRCGGATGCA